jgi:hypothetical protein
MAPTAVVSEGNGHNMITNKRKGISPMRFSLEHASVIYVSFTEFVDNVRKDMHYYALVGLKVGCLPFAAERELI